MGRDRPQLAGEDREKVVRLVLEEGRGITELRCEMWLSELDVRRWVAQARYAVRPIAAQRHRETLATGDWNPMPTA